MPAQAKERVGSWKISGSHARLSLSAEADCDNPK
jgi:hypothetical protein